MMAVVGPKHQLFIYQCGSHQLYHPSMAANSLFPCLKLIFRFIHLNPNLYLHQTVAVSSLHLFSLSIKKS
ncbi:hypothetical protein L6452_29970 [Arctium lappa]|uniref:Uncharacterized protein n=1 Tax=Arctium lappa TaxID=4217 RepID=A0ACB8ZHT2_ARCLA|nr:hypothetical protein L6452_29970 [Arctium lappa]